MRKHLRSDYFNENELVKIGDAYAWPEPPTIGAAVELNSGGPRMVIVDLDGDDRICAWAGGEATFKWQILKPWIIA